jgi:hypothetical protein
MRETGVAPVEEKLVQHRLRWFGHIQWRPAEAPIRSGVIRRSGNEKRGRERPNSLDATYTPFFRGFHHLGAPRLSLLYAEVGTTPSVGVRLAPEARREACPSRFSTPK